jgi:hypothetical protein
MARILVQSNDHRIVFDARNVRHAQITADESPGGLLDRLERAVQDADRDPISRNRAPEGLLGIVPVSRLPRCKRVGRSLGSSLQA